MFLEPFLIVGETVQLASYILLFRSNISRNSVLGLSCDFTLYSFLWYMCLSLSGFGYAFLHQIRLQYANRYPLYPEFSTSLPILAAHVAGLVVTLGIMAQVFWSHRKSRPKTETTSLLCRVAVLLLLLIFISFFWQFIRGRATVNLLDLADLLWTFGTFFLAVRLVLQVSTNWFFSKFAAMHRRYLLWQFTAMSLVTFGLILSHHVPWHEMPANGPTLFSVGMNWTVWSLLVFQKRHYLLKYLPL